MDTLCVMLYKNISHLTTGKLFITLAFIIYKPIHALEHWCRNEHTGLTLTIL